MLQIVGNKALRAWHLGRRQCHLLAFSIGFLIVYGMISVSADKELLNLSSLKGLAVLKGLQKKLENEV